MEATLSAKMKSDLCERAADNPTLPMKEVYNQYMSSDAPPVEDDLLEPLLRSCKSQMYRARRQNMPPPPATREDINLEGQWALINDKDQQFLLHQDDDMVLFATNKNTEMMAAADAIFMAGTFKISPPQFTQLFTLHIIYMGFFIPVISLVFYCFQ